MQVDLSLRIDPPFNSRNVISTYGERTYMDARRLANEFGKRVGEQFYVLERKLEEQPNFSP